MQVFDAIIRSKLLYGLETMELTKGMSKRLNAVQMRGLRQILQAPTTYEDRTWTNKRVLETIALETSIEIKLFSEIWIQR